MSTEATKPEIKISDVITMLENGTSREKIRVHYGLTKIQAVKLWKQPKLKGRKVHKEHMGTVGFEVVDDAPNVIPLPERQRKAKVAKTDESSITTSVAPVQEAEETKEEVNTDNNTESVETSEEAVY